MGGTRFPEWAVAERYGYDLGMSTSCNHCMNDLHEGSMVYKDSEERNTYYCSETCVHQANGSALCEWCGEPNEFLDEVDDSDPSVGYRSTLLICPACKTARRTGAPIRLAPGDEDDYDEELDWDQDSLSYEETVEGQDAGLRPKEADHDA